MASIGDLENQALTWSVAVSNAAGGSVSPRSGGPIHLFAGPLTRFTSSAPTKATATLTVTDSQGASTRTSCSVTVK